MTNSRKPNGYLKDFSNIESELNQIIEELDHFPLGPELRNMGKSSIYFAMIKFNNYLNQIKNKSL